MVGEAYRAEGNKRREKNETTHSIINKMYILKKNLIYREIIWGTIKYSYFITKVIKVLKVSKSLVNFSSLLSCSKKWKEVK